MKQNRGPRHKATQLQPFFSTKELKTCSGEKIASLTNGAEKTGYPFVED
jgi:hypothetical protein